MSPLFPEIDILEQSPPRASGDEPLGTLVVLVTMLSAPRERG